VLIDFTPALKEEALKIASQYKFGPLYSPPSCPTQTAGALFLLPRMWAGSIGRAGRGSRDGRPLCRLGHPERVPGGAEGRSEPLDMGYVGGRGAAVVGGWPWRWGWPGRCRSGPGPGPRRDICSNLDDSGGA